MSYLPELRSSLVKAAARQADITTPAGSRPRRRPSFGGLALIGASLAALAVAALVLVLAGHRGTDALTPAAPVPTSPGQAAAQVLSEFHPPAGAVPISADPTYPPRLSAPVTAIPVAGGVDLYRLYRLTGDPEKIMNQIANAPALRREQMPNGDASGSATDASSGLGSSASEVLSLGLRGGLARSFQIRAIGLAHGGIALRVDVEAWWPVPRPASERIPAHATAVAVALVGTPASPGLRRSRRLTGADLTETVALLNSLGIEQPHPPACDDPSSFRIRLTFEGAGSGPPAVASVRPGCNTVDVWLGGRAQPRLTFASTASAVDALRYVRFMEMLEGMPRSKSLKDLLRAVVSSSSSSTVSTSSTMAAPARTR